MPTPAAARKADENERRRDEGLPVQSSAGALSDERREHLEEIDASWCPSWPVTWQRCFHLVRMPLEAGETSPTAAGEVLRQGEGLERWVTSMRLGWEPTNHSPALARTSTDLHESFALQRARVTQLSLRAEQLGPAKHAHRQLLLDTSDDKAHRIEAAADRARARFGPHAIRPAALATSPRH
ncbi:hypothetical protein [Streptomyces sp. NPDC056341]|uniref:hypothetical protein n=2 Tax=Streptomyces TaxID=1883 RepID=UPI0035DA1A61